MVLIRHLFRIIQQKSNLLPFFFQSPFTYPLSILYCLSLLFALSDIGWGFVVLIFLGPNLLSLAIGAFLLRLGMKRRNKTLLYASIGLYLLSIILAFDPDWEIFRIAPIVLGILVLIGTLLVKDEKSY